ncbi:MAG: anthranilate phosphoribosyltransferase [Deltaproteobacteria bacterium]|nr:anthranilate phosphoribosyltransferase [Deltaproteobacteria bacterium]MBW2051232.1 anthranilate phosphoribosyltransferase [Deltaproteobacteria bacterium]MBW2141097.1 anthranilate phosphoribosyltransferase [Deltaproteobacteria bacterium]MBW2322975.1 anthranilate phosphoribosyltransferase [Deltaproteobacteria bacterium]
MITQAITEVIEGRDLSDEMMTGAMEEIMGGQATPAQIAALIVGLRVKEETVTEIAASARVMRRFATKIQLGNNLVNVDREEINLDNETIVDTCGTGGDGTRTFNISTATAFVVAGAGLRVAKHGNRAVSSQCGSADVVEKLGIRLDLTPAEVEKAIEEVGIGFLYAPLFHGAMAHAAPVRREIGVRTIFNILGPLTNPAGAHVQVLGVYREDLTEKLARVLGELGSREAFVVHGEGSMDELSIIGRTRIAHLKKGRVNSFDLTPEDVGLSPAPIEDIQGGDSEVNARIIRHIMEGQAGPCRDIVMLNAAAAFVVAGRVSNMAEGVALAGETIDSARALEKLEALINFGKGKPES